MINKLTIKHIWYLDGTFNVPQCTRKKKKRFISKPISNLILISLNCNDNNKIWIYIELCNTNKSIFCCCGIQNLMEHLRIDEKKKNVNYSIFFFNCLRNKTGNRETSETSPKIRNDWKLRASDELVKSFKVVPAWM